MTQQQDHVPAGVCWWKRLLVTLAYVGVTVLVFIGLAYLVTSDGCPSHNTCTKGDEIIFAVIGLLDFVLGVVLFFVGMKGLLPGTRQLRR